MTTKAKKLKPSDGSVADRIRLAVVKQPGISFEAAAKAAGVKAEPASHQFNVWQHAHRTLVMFEQRYAGK